MTAAFLLYFDSEAKYISDTWFLMRKLRQLRTWTMEASRGRIVTGTRMVSKGK